MTTNFRKLSTGNWMGRNGKYYAFIFKRPHGKWCAFVTKDKQPVAAEGYFTTSLHTIGKAMSFVESKINRDQTFKL
jgi:hypothetical protein